MSEELKTLNDLDFVRCCKRGKDCAEELKAVAIKWGKFVKRFGLEGWSPKSLFDFFMDKLNVTEEDLEEEEK